MPQYQDLLNGKGKEVVHEQNWAKRRRYNFVTSASSSTPTGLFIRESSNIENCSDASSDEDVSVPLVSTLPTLDVSKPGGVFEQGESSKAQKRHRESSCYQGFTPQEMDKSNTEVAVCDEQNKEKTNCALDRRLARQARDRARRQSMTPEEREEINSRRRELRRSRQQNLTPEEREEINARRRAQRQNMTPQERELINARRRAARHCLTLEERNAQQKEYRNRLTDEDKHKIKVQRQEHWQKLPVEKKKEANARRRQRRQSLSPEERQALLDKRNEIYATRRDTPCKESIALQHSPSSLKSCQSSCSSAPLQSRPTQNFSRNQGHLESIHEEGDGVQVVYPSSGIYENDDICMGPPSIQCPISTSCPGDSNYSDSRTESFVTDDDGNSNVSQEEDDEYFMFTAKGDNDSDEQVETFETESTILDPYDHVYQNIPDSTHMLEPKPDCKHCGAKRFQYEPDGFCCRSGKIKLAHSEPPLELQRLYTSSDPDAVHFRDNIRYFNGHFSFTTLGVSLDNRYTNMKSGVYTFRAHGQIYHNIFSFGRSEDGPRHLELYFYDDDPTLQHRFRHSPNLDRDVIRRLVDQYKRWL